MRKFLIATAAIALAQTGAQAAPIIGLYNTGVNAGGSGFGVGGGVTSGNGFDPNWANTSSAGTAGTDAYNGGTNGSFPLNGPWAAEDTTSRWLTPTANAGDSFDPSADGLYTYTLTFNLPTVSNSRFTGRFLVDNVVDSILLNGTTNLGSGSGFGTNDWTNFAANSGFVSGANTLSFNIRNAAQQSGNPLGLRVEFITSAIPEPATWAMMILGFGVVGAAMRRRQKPVRTGLSFA